MKDQGNCYRYFNGVRYCNWCDLVFSNEENEKIIKEAKEQFRSVRKIKHSKGFFQLFVSGNKSADGELLCHTKFKEPITAIKNDVVTITISITLK